MWVERIEIGGFGRLRNLSIDLQDGLNVVSGLNEAGKSTLHQAIATALFGCFSSTDRRKEQDAERRRERYAPWDGGPYRISIVTRNAGGVALRIDWDLSGRTSFVARDAITGEDRTSAIRGVGDGVLRTDTHGISRAVFERSLVVRQGELAAIADEEGAVAAALESALASSERNASASRAVEILAAQRDSIGTARSSKRPLPLARAEAHHAAEALRAAEAARAEIEGAALEARAAGITAEAAERRLAGSRATASGRRLAELDEWVSRVGALETRLHELERKRAALSDAAPIDPAAIVELENARDARATAADRAERARRAADAVEPALADAEARLREIDCAVGMHEPYRGGPDGAALRELDTVVARLRARPASLPVTTRRPAVALGTAASLVVAAIVAAVALGLVPAAALVVLAGVAGALGTHWLMIERDRRRQAQHVNDEDEERRSQLLAAAGIHPESAGGEARFRHEATCRATFEDASARATALRVEVQQLARERTESRRLDGELVEGERRVRDAFLRVGVDPSDERAAAATIETRRERTALRLSFDAEHEKLTAEHAGLLAGRDPRALRTEAVELRAAGVLPEQGASDRADDENVEDVAREARVRAAALAAQFDTLAAGLADTSVLAEQLASARDREARLERAHEVLSIAADALEEAAAETYRDLAPHLNRALSAALDRATDGRYREVRVAPDLSVVVHGPERAAPVALDDLSFGTRELVHLVQRLELARLLGGDDPPPILLDDVLGHCDAPRRAALAGLIADASTRQQVIVLATTPEAAEALLGSTPDAMHVDLSAHTPTLV
jgi:DNA repair exonuclease SbcCD ATPase subunit